VRFLSLFHLLNQFQNYKYCTITVKKNVILFPDVTIRRTTLITYIFFDYSVSVFQSRNGEEGGRDPPVLCFAVNLSESLANARFSVPMCDKGENTQTNREYGSKVDRHVSSDRSVE
jgi:hypothetical protein